MPSSSFKMIATVLEGGEKVFRDDIAQLIKAGVGHASFTLVQIGDTEATLNGSLPDDDIELDGASFAELLEDEMVSVKGIYLDLTVTFDS
jgi:hypothetical protein